MMWQKHTCEKSHVSNLLMTTASCLMQVMQYKQDDVAKAYLGEVTCVQLADDDSQLLDPEAAGQLRMLPGLPRA